MPDLLRDQLQTTLGAGYTLVRELGGGGMSRVYVAHEEALGRDVVVKVLAPELAEGLSAERFAREIRLAASLQEPHIVPVLAAGATLDGLPYYTMPYVQGESLRERLRRGAVPATEAVSILRDVAHALAYAHAHGVVHRDVKPENVLLSSGTAVVTDFGIAKALQLATTQTRAPLPGGALPDDAHDIPRMLTQVGVSLGTPAYMAPEQAAGDPAVDHRADLYAWGLVAYELLTGRHVFADKVSAQQLMAAQFGGTPAPLIAPGVARPLTELVMRCLAKDPAARPESATVLLAVLSDTGAMLPHRAPSLRARVAAGAAAVAVVVVGALAWRSNAVGVRTAEAAGPMMLAVLPFDNAGPPEQAAFGDGLTDAVTAKLGALPGLVVIDRRSAAKYRQTTKPTQQIGAELGVRYLLEGVVRWARDGAGVWRAQVTPTLVDARAGTTRWTGEPVVVVPDDPFAAQGAIATKVAEALQVALRPADRARLARPMSESPEAFEAYLRGRAILDAHGRASTAPYEIRRAAFEFERAVALDSSFAQAWAELARAEYALATLSPGDRAAEARMRRAIARAGSHAAGQPRLRLTLALQRIYYDRDTSGVDALIQSAVDGAPNDGAILADASLALARRQQYDSAYALARRAATLDPRSAPPIHSAAVLATAMRRRDDALRYGDALIALDSTDERGWSVRLDVERLHGDTLAMQRDLARALARIPRPSNLLLSQMPYAGGVYAMRYVALSARELGVATVADSVLAYYDLKADVFLSRGDVPRARVYYDSILTLLAERRLSGFHESFLLGERALAAATLDRPEEARRLLARAMAAARPIATRADLSDVLNPYLVAAVYAWLHEPDTAVRWLEIGLGNPIRGYTARGLAIRAKLLPLRGTPAFDRFLREHAR